MSPVSMLLMGMVISQYKLRELLTIPQNYVIIAMRLVVIPCVVVAVLKLLKLEMLVLPTLMVLAMPTSMNTIVFSKLMGQDSKPGASMALISTILCCATIPLCLWIFGII
jgi:predicted permease